jgi:hypothetical protein
MADQPLPYGYEDLEVLLTIEPNRRYNIGPKLGKYERLLEMGLLLDISDHFSGINRGVVMSSAGKLVHYLAGRLKSLEQAISV